MGDVGTGTLSIGAVISTGGVKNRAPKDPSCHAGVQNDIPSGADGRSLAGAEKTDASIDKTTARESAVINVSKAFLCVSFLRNVIAGITPLQIFLDGIQNSDL
jgi:hypothetical protein